MTSSGLTPEQFGDVIVSPEFNDCIAKLGRYTLAHLAEGGFAVYKAPESGIVTISEPELPPEDKSIKSVYSIGTRYGFNARPLIRDGNGAIRSDIAFLVHSHPSGEKGLRPTITDMRVHEVLSKYNPGMIGGILIASTCNHMEEALLQLYRRTETDPDAYFHEFETTMPVERDAMLGMLRRQGYYTATATFDLHTERLDTHVAEVVSELFG